MNKWYYIFSNLLDVFLFLPFPSFSLLGQFGAVLLDLQRSFPCQYKDTDDKFVMLQERLSSDHAKILWCLENLGLICAFEVGRCTQEHKFDDACNKNIIHPQYPFFP